MIKKGQSVRIGSEPRGSQDYMWGRCQEVNVGQIGVSMEDSYDIDDSVSVLIDLEQVEFPHRALSVINGDYDKRISELETLVRELMQWKEQEWEHGMGDDL